MYLYIRPPQFQSGTDNCFFKMESLRTEAKQDVVIRDFTIDYSNIDPHFLLWAAVVRNSVDMLDTAMQLGASLDIEPSPLYAAMWHYDLACRLWQYGARPAEIIYRPDGSYIFRFTVGGDMLVFPTHPLHKYVKN